MKAPNGSEKDRTMHFSHFARSCVYPLWIANLIAFFLVHQQVRAAETNLVQALRAFMGITQKTSADANAPGDARDLAGKSVTIDLPGLPSGAKKLELVMLFPKKESGIAPFLIGKYEVTQGQWQAVMGNNPSDYKKGPDYPVEMVSWDDAKAFCAKLKSLVGSKLPNEFIFRLPTDPEWSWAVGLENEKGNTPQEKHMKIADVYPWGTQWPPPKGAGNYDDYSNFKIPDFSDGYESTSPVGSFNPNKNGLYDMGGNVWEWCENWYDEKKQCRVLRGASWFLSTFDFLLSSFRYFDTPDFRVNVIGFRVVLGMSLP